MYILGISCYYHDAAACLIKDGKIVAAAEEERFTRQKHDSSFPENAIDFCLKQGKLNNQDLDYVVFYEKPFLKFQRILLSSLSTFPKSSASFREAMQIWLTKKLWIKQEIASFLSIDLAKILFCEHHLSHAGSCYYPSPFKKAAILTVDGIGEWTSTTFGMGEANKITILKEIHFPQSLGLFYSAFTAFLGFEVNEGEWKVMGLAPYGKPKFVDKIKKTIKQHQDGSFTLDLSYFSFHYSEKQSFSEKLIKLLGDPVKPAKSYLVNQRAADIAASVQLVTEKIMVGLAKKLKQQTNMENLCLAGGVALNARANYRILKESGFKNIYIQPAASDAGGALGAALYLYHHVLNKSAVKTPRGWSAYKDSPDGEGISNNRYITSNAYLGQQWSNGAIEQFLKTESGKDTPWVTAVKTPQGWPAYKDSPGVEGSIKRWRKLNDGQLIDFTSDAIIQGKVIGWMQGRFEWGPRALGARSILADARNPKMKEIINGKVKFREAFRPFAPSVLAEHASEVFDLSAINNDPGSNSRKNDPGSEHYPLRFMLYVVPVKKEWRKKVPAINHIDNTSRPQLVYGEENPLYYKLIKSFYKKTGVPLILNTSFNLHGEPIVASPADAYSTFTRSGIDVLVMGNFVCEKKNVFYL